MSMNDFMTIVEKLQELSACENSIQWASGLGHNDHGRAWAECPRGDWMLWYAAKCGVDRRLVVEVACEIAEGAVRRRWKGGPEPQAAIDTARAWIRGEATIERVREARCAASYAADAANATDLVDPYAASAVAYAAYAAEAAACAARAACAAEAAAACAACDAADAAAYAVAARPCDEAPARYAALIRSRIPYAAIAAALGLETSRAAQPLDEC